MDLQSENVQIFIIIEHLKTYDQNTFSYLIIIRERLNIEFRERFNDIIRERLNVIIREDQKSSIKYLTSDNI